MNSFKLHGIGGAEKAAAISRHRRGIRRIREVLASLISPRFVFLVGNAIVVVLFLISGRFPPGDGVKAVDFYEEYAGRYRSNRGEGEEDERREPGAVKNGGVEVGRKMNRCRSEIVGRAAGEGQRDLRRSVSEKRWRSGGECGRRTGGSGCSYAEDGMSSEEFRRTVEAFIARQRRILREEEEGFPAGVSV